MSRASPARSPRAVGSAGLPVAPGNLAGLDAHTGGALALFCFSDVRPLAGVAGFVDWRLCGSLSRTIEGGFFRGERGEVMLLPARSRRSFKCYFVFGLGLRAQCTSEVYREVVGNALEVLRTAGVRSITLAAPAARRHPGVEADFACAVADLARPHVELLLVDRNRDT